MEQGNAFTAYEDTNRPRKSQGRKPGPRYKRVAPSGPASRGAEGGHGEGNRCHLTPSPHCSAGVDALNLMANAPWPLGYFWGQVCLTPGEDGARSILHHLLEEGHVLGQTLPDLWCLCSASNAMGCFLPFGVTLSSWKITLSSASSPPAGPELVL